MYPDRQIVMATTTTTRVHLHAHATLLGALDRRRGSAKEAHPARHRGMENDCALVKDFCDSVKQSHTLLIEITFFNGGNVLIEHDLYRSF